MCVGIYLLTPKPSPLFTLTVMVNWPRGRHQGKLSQFGVVDWCVCGEKTEL